jgi:hypothetical protein
MKPSKEFCFVCNKPVFHSSRQHLQHHLITNHPDIFEVVKTGSVHLNDIVSFPGIPCGLIKVEFAFPMQIEGRRATLVLGHRLCHKMDCSTTWFDDEGNLLFEWVLLFDHLRNEDMSILKLWPNDESKSYLLKTDQPTMICVFHLPKKIRARLFETGSLPPVPLTQEGKEAYWENYYTTQKGKFRNTVTQQFFKGQDIFKLFKEPMETAKKACKSEKRTTSVKNIKSFVLKQHTFKIKVLLEDPMVKNGIYISKYRDRSTKETKEKAEEELRQWEEEQTLRAKAKAVPVQVQADQPESVEEMETDHPEMTPETNETEHADFEATEVETLATEVLNPNMATPSEENVYPGSPAPGPERTAFLEQLLWDSKASKSAVPVGTLNFSLHMPVNWSLTGGHNDSPFVSSVSRENVNIKHIDHTDFQVNRVVLSLVAVNKDGSMKRDIFREQFEVAAPPPTEINPPDSPTAEDANPPKTDLFVHEQLPPFLVTDEEIIDTMAEADSNDLDALLGAETFECNFCLFKTAIPAELNYHVNELHLDRLNPGTSGTSTTVNELTKFPTTTPTTVTTIENSATSEYVCCLCHYPGTSSDDHEAHILNIHPEIFRSDDEPSNSERQSAVKKEPSKNIGNSTTSEYICCLCRYHGTSAENLDAHLEVSHGHMSQPSSKKPATRSQTRKAAEPTKRPIEDNKPEGQRLKKSNEKPPVKKRRKMPNNLVHCNQDSTDDDDCSWVYDDLEKKRLHTNNTTTTTN